MIQVRQIFQLKFGKSDEFLALVNGMFEGAPTDVPAEFLKTRVLTDVSGPFFTVVLENEFESLGEWEAAFAKLMSSGDGGTGDQMNELVKSGRREFFRIER